MSISKRDLLTIADLSRTEVMELLARSREFKAGRARGEGKAALMGKSVVLLFEKPSTRTRVSFEVGISEMGGQPLYLNRNDIQLSRGEPVKDTARVLSRYVHGVVIRAYRHEDVEEFAAWCAVPVVNALTDRFHPCQVLADLFTAMEAGLDLATMKVAYIGDGNNVANSWIMAASVVGFNLTLACPEGFEPSAALLHQARAKGHGSIEVVREPERAAAAADVLYTDVWVSMGQDEEVETRKAAFAGYQINETLLAQASPRALIMHCLPAHRGEEISDQAMEHERSVIMDQAENRLHVQKAILEKLLCEK